MADHPRMNDKTGNTEVQVIDQHGLNLGVMKREAAVQLASEAGLVFVEIAPAAVPAVCKLVQPR
jgi:translation initiation factor IF-3